MTNISKLPIEERVRIYHEQATMLAAMAEKDGVIITIERYSLKPLAMRNHVPMIQTREKR